MVLPDHDIDLGVASEGDRIVFTERITPTGIQVDATTRHEDAPKVGLAATRDADLKGRVKEA